MKHKTQTEKVVAVRSRLRKVEEKSRLFFLFTAAQVEEVLPEVVTRPVPFAPSFLQGIALWRGHLLPVIDLEKRFSLEGGERKGKNRFLVIRTGAPENPTGKQILRCILRVSDEIHSMEATDARSMTSSKSFGIDASLVRGTYHRNENIYIIPELVSILQNQQSSVSNY